jgi:hypothetical protein
MENCRIDVKDELKLLEICYETDQIPAQAQEAELTVAIAGLGDEQHVKGTVKDAVCRIVLPYPYEELALWDEFTPKLYDIAAQVRFLNGGAALEERAISGRVGFREIHSLGTQFYVNDHVTFLRAVELPVLNAQRSETDWVQHLSELKNRGLNCISVSGEALDTALLNAADFCGIYVKVHVQKEQKADVNGSEAAEVCKKYAEGFVQHPSLVLVSVCDGAGQILNAVICQKTEEKAYCGSWVEFAVRDRQDYSDAPDTSSNHLEDIRKQDCPTMVTNVGEWRNPVKNPGDGLCYLAQICTREAVEEALRTPKFGGYCLHPDAAVLSLSEKRMREFAGPVVPLLMMKKYVWSADETFTANMMIANYGQEKLFERISVSAYDERGQRYAVTSNKVRLNRGNVVSVGQLRIPLEQFAPGQRLELTISVDNTPYRNHYAIWLFADDISVKVPEHVHITRRLDERTRLLLANGKKVVYIPKLNRIKGDAGWFSPLASEAASNRETVAAGGICCDPSHPALKGFPTEEMVDFQWWHLLHNSIPVVLPENLKQGFIVSMPGMTPDRADRGLIFEACVGTGHLLVCTIDLLIQLDRPEARQLYASLLAYVASVRFAPVCQVSAEVLEQLL